jgi:hypothetical protein
MIAAVIPSASRSTRVAPGQHTLKPLPSWAPEALAAGFEHPEPWCGSLPLRGSRATRHPAAASLPLTAATAVKRRGSAPLPHMSSLTIGPTLGFVEAPTLGNEDEVMGSHDKPTTRRYTREQKGQAVRLVRTIRAETGRQEGRFVVSRSRAGASHSRRWRAPRPQRVAVRVHSAAPRARADRPIWRSVMTSRRRELVPLPGHHPAVEGRRRLGRLGLSRPSSRRDSVPRDRN